MPNKNVIRDNKLSWQAERQEGRRAGRFCLT